MSEPVSDQEVVPRLLTVRKAASYLGISKKTLYYWIESKQIPYFRVGRLVFFDRGDIEGWLARSRAEPVPRASAADLPEPKLSGKSQAGH